MTWYLQHKELNFSSKLRVEHFRILGFIWTRIEFFFQYHNLSNSYAFLKRPLIWLFDYIDKTGFLIYLQYCITLDNYFFHEVVLVRARLSRRNISEWIVRRMKKGCPFMIYVFAYLWLMFSYQKASNHRILKILTFGQKERLTFLLVWRLP